MIWSVGMQLKIPIWNREALGKLEETRLRRRQEELRLSLLRNQISVDVESAFQDMTAEHARLGAAREAVGLGREQLSAQERDLAAGRTTVRKVLEAQDQLSIAQDKEVQSLINYASARSRLDAAQALSFDTYRLVVQR
jgi:outer membrane protein TolC